MPNFILITFLMILFVCLILGIYDMKNNGHFQVTSPPPSKHNLTGNVDNDQTSLSQKLKSNGEVGSGSYGVIHRESLGNPCGDGRVHPAGQFNNQQGEINENKKNN